MISPWQYLRRCIEVDVNLTEPDICMALAIITEAQFVKYIFPFGLNTHTNSAKAFGQWIITCGRNKPCAA